MALTEEQKALLKQQAEDRKAARHQARIDRVFAHNARKWQKAGMRKAAARHKANAEGSL